jgi:energy-coupling factor transport system substrate-specific component
MPTTQGYSTRKLTYLSLLTAAGVVGRLAFTWIPNVQPMTAIFLLLAFACPVSQALIVALLGVLITNLYLGMGTWTISQLIAFAAIIFFFHLCGKISIVKKQPILQAILAFVCGLLYGIVVSIMEVTIYQLPSFWAYYSQGVFFDVLHAGGNFFFYLLCLPIFNRLFLPVLGKLEHRG